MAMDRYNVFRVQTNVGGHAQIAPRQLSEMSERPSEHVAKIGNGHSQYDCKPGLGPAAWASDIPSQARAYYKPKSGPGFGWA